MRRKILNVKRKRIKKQKTKKKDRPDENENQNLEIFRVFCFCRISTLKITSNIFSNDNEEIEQLQRNGNCDDRI